ncbi:hypothetical protein EMN47_05085 [Prolixibacteraceae bacterium JC049]|nr:hypothetical protein [Prolixibacteraceae bacterium JC049]
MTASCYILYSKSLDGFYVGATQDDVAKRLEKHNIHSYGTHRYTAKANDWEVFLVLEANNFAHAVRLERKIKSMKSKVYIQNLKKYPELKNKILSETST